MAREKISLVSEEEIRKETVEHTISAGLMTNAIYETLTPEEQKSVRNILFDMYSAPVVAPVALSGLEFIVMGLAKILMIRDERALTPSEQAFYDRYKQMVMQHEITMDAGDWYVPYAEDAMLKTKQNREEYKARKVDITGSFA